MWTFCIFAIKPNDEKELFFSASLLRSKEKRKKKQKKAFPFLCVLYLDKYQKLKCGFNVSNLCAINMISYNFMFLFCLGNRTAAAAIVEKERKNRIHQKRKWDRNTRRKSSFCLFIWIKNKKKKNRLIEAKEDGIYYRNNSIETSSTKQNKKNKNEEKWRRETVFT